LDETYTFPTVTTTPYPTITITPTSTPTPTEMPWINKRITNSLGDSTGPNIAWSGITYGIVWSDKRDGFEPEIYFTITDNHGQKIIEDTRITESANLISNSSQIVWIGDSWAILWSEYSRYDNQNSMNGCSLMFRKISSNGTPLSDNLTVVTDNYGFCPSNPRLLWNGSQFGIFWHENRQNTETTRVYYTSLDSSGHKLLGDVPITAIDSGLLDVSWNGTNYMILWRQQPSYLGLNYLTRLILMEIK